MVKVLKVPPTHGAKPETFSTFESEDVYAHTDRTKAGKIRYAKEGQASEEGLKAITLTKIFAESCKKVGKRAVLKVERPTPKLVKGEPVPKCLPLADWTTWTYQSMYDECHEAARAFMTLGLQPFDAVAIFGFNAPEWVMGEMAAIMAGGCAAGIYPTDTPVQVVYKAKHSGARVAVCEGVAQANAFLNAAEELPKLSAVVVWDPTVDESKLEDRKVSDDRTIRVVHWKNLKALAEETPEKDLEARVEAQEPGNVCAYIYTSGTTGNPKAVMISHDNLVFNAMAVINNMPPSFGTLNTQERILSYLPLSHVAGMLLDIIAPIITPHARGGYVTMHFARPYDLKVGAVGDRLRMVKPTLFLGVPRVWEKVAESIKKAGASTTGAKKAIATWGRNKGLAAQRNTQLGGSGRTPMFYGLAETVVLNKIKAAMGLQCCKFAFTGAAPIRLETLEFFGSLGIQINECYGMSECTGATTWSTDAAHVWASCGWALPGEEVKVFRTEGGEKKEVAAAKDLTKPTEEEQGEICFRGRHVMIGYMANPDLGEEHVAEITKKTNEAIDSEGWLHSGDKGCMDARGMVKITGRYKELIITAGGENIAPVPIEDAIKALCPAISNIMMLGDQKKFNIALVTLKAEGATGDLPGGEELAGEAAELNPKVKTIKEASADETVIKAITDAIVATNNNGEVCPSNAAKIQKFTILPYDFSVQTSELTPTFKLKRSVVQKKHTAMVDKIYESSETFLAYDPWPTDAFGDDEEAREAAAVEAKKDMPTESLVDKEVMEQEEGDADKVQEAKDDEAKSEGPKEEEAPKKEEAPKEGEAKDEAPKEEAAKEESA